MGKRDDCGRVRVDRGRRASRAKRRTDVTYAPSGEGLYNIILFFYVTMNRHASIYIINSDDKTLLHFKKFWLSLSEKLTYPLGKLILALEQLAQERVT